MYRDVYPHRFSVEEAVVRLRALTDYWDAAYGTRTEWNGSTGIIRGRVLGLSFDARFVVEPDRLHGELEVSPLAVRLGGRRYLQRKLDRYFDPDTPLEALRTVPSAARA